MGYRLDVRFVREPGIKASVAARSGEKPPATSRGKQKQGTTRRTKTAV
jgi:hypothetical protein